MALQPPTQARSRPGSGRRASHFLRAPFSSLSGCFSLTPSLSLGEGWGEGEERVRRLCPYQNGPGLSQLHLGSPRAIPNLSSLVGIRNPNYPFVTPHGPAVVYCKVELAAVFEAGLGRFHRAF
jgi:hypothetical protein